MTKRFNRGATAKFVIAKMSWNGDDARENLKKKLKISEVSGTAKKRDEKQEKERRNGAGTERRTTRREHRKT